MSPALEISVRRTSLERTAAAGGAMYGDDKPRRSICPVSASAPPLFPCGGEGKVSLSPLFRFCVAVLPDIAPEVPNSRASENSSGSRLRIPCCCCSSALVRENSAVFSRLFSPKDCSSSSFVFARALCRGCRTSEVGAEGATMAAAARDVKADGGVVGRLALGRLAFLPCSFGDPGTISFAAEEDGLLTFSAGGEGGGRS